MSERLFDVRHAHFCPGEHCSKRCGPTDCTCAPCRTDCPFCKARRTIGSRPQPEPDFSQLPNRQTRLFGTFNQPKGD